jgi:hypothetical protein
MSTREVLLDAYHGIPLDWHQLEQLNSNPLIPNAHLFIDFIYRRRAVITGSARLTILVYYGVYFCLIRLRITTDGVTFCFLFEMYHPAC